MNLRFPAQRQQVLAVLLLRSDQGNQTPYSTRPPEWRLACAFATCKAIKFIASCAYLESARGQFGFISSAIPEC